MIKALRDLRHKSQVFACGIGMACAFAVASSSITLAVIGVHTRRANIGKLLIVQPIQKNSLVGTLVRIVGESSATVHVSVERVDIGADVILAAFDVRRWVHNMLTSLEQWVNFDLATNSICFWLIGNHVLAWRMLNGSCARHVDLIGVGERENVSFNESVRWIKVVAALEVVGAAQTASVSDEMLIESDVNPEAVKDHPEVFALDGVEELRELTHVDVAVLERQLIGEQ